MYTCTYLLLRWSIVGNNTRVLQFIYGHICTYSVLVEYGTRVLRTQYTCIAIYIWPYMHVYSVLVEYGTRVLRTHVVQYTCLVPVHVFTGIAIVSFPCNFAPQTGTICRNWPKNNGRNMAERNKFVYALLPG